MSRPKSRSWLNSLAPGPEVKMRLPGRVGGGPMMPASAKRAPASVTVRETLLAVPGAMALQSTYSRSLLVALTGWAQEDDRRRCYEAGFDGHLPKPVEWEALRQFLAHPKLLRHPPSAS